MATKAERIAEELKALVSDGSGLTEALRDQDWAAFSGGYQEWYTRALAVIRALLPDREDDFRRLHDRDTRRKSISLATYTLEDYVQAVSPRWPEIDIHNAALVKFMNQLRIVESAQSRLSDILADIRGVLQADLFDSEVDSARHLAKNGHSRAAGAVAGVVLEGHLAQLCSNHRVTLRKRAPHISDFNDALKSGGVLDVAQWRWIQRLADIRNLCDHKKQRDPTPDEVTELIDGVDRAIKTLR